MSEKKYTEEQLRKAIDKALHYGDQEMGVLKGKRDLLQGLLKQLTSELSFIESQIKLREDSDILDLFANDEKVLSVSKDSHTPSSYMKEAIKAFEED